MTCKIFTLQRILKADFGAQQKPAKKENGKTGILKAEIGDIASLVVMLNQLRYFMSFFCNN